MNDQYPTADIPYELIIKSQVESLDAVEKDQLHAWKMAKPENTRVYEEVLSLQADLSLLSEYQNLEVSQAWLAFDREIKTRQTDRWKAGVLAAAACTAALICVSLLFVPKQTPYKTGERQVRTIRASDGTLLVLSENTSMVATSSLIKGIRSVKLLYGEMSCTVRHNPAQPFTVTTDRLVMEDLGTKFQLEKHFDRVSLQVTEGQVSMSKLNEGLKGALIQTLGRDQHISLDEKTYHIQVSPPEKAGIQDSSPNFQFIHTPLREVMRQIEAHFKIHIVFKHKQLENRVLTGRFNDLSADSLLAQICTVMNLEAVKKDQSFLLSSK